MSKADTLERLIDTGFQQLLALGNDLRAKEPNGKPAITPSEMTKALEAATAWYSAKHATDGDEGFGAAFRKKGAA